MNHITSITRTLKGLFLAGAMLAPSLMTAQLDRSRPPAPGPAPEVHLGEHASFALPNGMKVIVVENHKLPIVSLQVRFDIPPITQEDKVGYIDLVGDLLTAGTSGYTKAALDEEVDRLGASLTASNDGVYASGLKKNLPALLGLVREVVQQPTFPVDEFEKARTRLRSSVQQRQDDPDAIADAVGRAATFGPWHPYGEVMTEATLNAITVDAVRAYYNRFFRPAQGYLVFVGDLTLNEAEKLATDYFAQWEGGPRQEMIIDGEEEVPGMGIVRYLKYPVLAPQYRQVVIVDRPGAPQSLIRVVYPLNLEPKDIRALKAQVMNTILGGGVFNARLMQNLREDKGYTYGAYSSLDSDRYNASFGASVSVRTEVTESAVAEIIKEMERMVNEPVDAADLELAKRYMAGSFARSLEDPRTVARFALNTYLNGLPKDHYATYLKRLEAITVADVQGAAQAFLQPDNAVVFVVGDKERIRRALIPLSMEPFNPVVELDVNGQPWSDPAEPVADVTVEHVIDSYVKAVGGAKAIAQVKDMQRIMTGKLGNSAAKVTERYATGGKYRKDVVVAGQVLQEIVTDGTRATDLLSRVLENLSGAQLAAVLAKGYPIPEAVSADGSIERTLEGRVVVDGKPCYKVSTLVGVDPVIEYYDVQSGLKVRRVEQELRSGETFTVTTDLKDYQAVGGVQFPHTIEQDGGVLGVAHLTVSEIVLNKGIPAAMFEVKQASGQE